MIYELRLTKEQLALIGEALVALPFARVAQLIGELRKQIEVQEPKPKLNNEQRETANGRDLGPGDR